MKIPLVFHSHPLLIRCISAFMFLLAACSSAATTPTSPTQPVSPVDLVQSGAAKVVVESEEKCSIPDFTVIKEGIKINEPQVGDVSRGTVATYTINCGNPYVTEKCIDVQDYYPDHFTSTVECITDEGGVWKGTCSGITDADIVCTLQGDGKYKGLQLDTNANESTMVMKFRVIKLNK